MLNEKLLKAINGTIEGIMDFAITYDDLDMTVDNILNDNNIYRIVEDEEGEDIENPEYIEIEKEVKEKILGDERIQLFEVGAYAYEGQIKNLNVSIICSKEYDNPFEAMNYEM